MKSEPKNKQNASINSRMLKYEANSEFPPNKFRNCFVLHLSAVHLSNFVSENLPYGKCDGNRVYKTLSEAAYNLCLYLPGCSVGFVSHDSVFYCVHETHGSKNVSAFITYAASAMTIEFNRLFMGVTSLLFNAKLVSLPSLFEIKNYFIWRQIRHLRSTVYNFLEQHHLNQESEQTIPFDNLLSLAKSHNDWANVPEEEKNGTLIWAFVDEIGNLNWGSGIASLFSTKEGSKPLLSSIKLFD